MADTNAETSADAGGVDTSSEQEQQSGSEAQQQQPKPEMVSRAELKKVIRERDQMKSSFHDVKNVVEGLREAFGGELPTADFLTEARTAMEAAQEAEIEKAKARGDYEKLLDEAQKKYAEQKRIDQAEREKIENAFRMERLENRARQIVAKYDPLPEAVDAAVRDLVNNGVEGKTIDLRMDESSGRFTDIIFDKRLGAEAVDEMTGDDLTWDKLGALYAKASPYYFRSSAASGGGTSGGNAPATNRGTDVEGLRARMAKGDMDAYREYKELRLKS